MTTPVPHHSFVTGATGLLGSQLVRQLLAGGGMVTALVRDLRRARRLLPDDPRLRRVVGDICEPSSYHGHLYGTDTVFHTAAYFREYYEPRVDRERLHRTNVTALTELLPASADAGVPVVVYISSTTVLRIRGGDAGDGTELIDEDSPPAPHQRKWLPGEQAGGRADDRQLGGPVEPAGVDNPAGLDVGSRRRWPNFRWSAVPGRGAGQAAGSSERRPSRGRRA